MSATMSLHNISEVKAKHSGDVSWLTFEDMKGNGVDLFIPYHVAAAMAQAYNAATEASKPAELAL